LLNKGITLLNLPDPLHLAPRSACSGTVTLPGSKSISNRALLMAALCGQPVTLKNVLESDDTARMIDALTTLGVSVKRSDLHPSEYQVEGCGGRWQPAHNELYLGNAGTAVRPLVAVLAASLSNTQVMRLDGNARMRERPIAALIDSLTAAGANIQCQAEQGFLPLTIESGFKGGEVTIDGSASSQYISALLMALPLLAEDSELLLVNEVISVPYIELTLSMLRDFGIQIDKHSDRHYKIPGRQSYRSPGSYFVEGDASGASYWIGAAAISGGPITIYGVGKNSIQGDVHFAELAQQMGANVEMLDNAIRVSRSTELKAIDVDCNDLPDAAMTLAPMALFAQGTTVIRNVASWRVKETDRLAAMAAELRKVGAQVEEGEDYLSVMAPAHWQHALLDTYDDHRMAMCSALIAFSPVGVSINDPQCCSKTYPQFFDEFSRLCHD